MRKLPIGIQDFAKIRENGFHYVDKTAAIHKLIDSGTTFFLSRPRRFGKSLLCSTLGAIWEGKRELFKGLAIDSLQWHWKKHPIIRLDLSPEDTSSEAILKDSLCFAIGISARALGVEVIGSTPAQQFRSLIETVSKTYSEKVVVIIDEYDKPLLGTIDKPELHAQVRDVLKGFYGVLKASDAHLAFLMLTGVTKFSQVSVFSDLNQLQDISMDSRFADICGITQSELEADFTDEVIKFSGEKQITGDEYLAQLKKWYNGYRFSKAPLTVYNPFGLLSHFSTGDFSPYWFATGTPTFLLKLIENQDIDIRTLENMELSVGDFGDYRKEKMQAIPVLYQAGYLTISAFHEESNTYTLDYPNDEVKISFAKALADRYTCAPESEQTSLVLKFFRSLRSGNVSGFMEAMIPFFGGIPYDLHDQTERHYQVVFYLIFRLLGQYCETEVKSALGRADAIVEAGEYVYCFEFKLNGTAEEALAQIDTKEYLTPYMGSGKKLVKVGVEFDKVKKNVGRWLSNG